jgi:hypothetical protein
VAVPAAWIPARRVMRVSPIRPLRMNEAWCRPEGSVVL